MKDYLKLKKLQELKDLIGNYDDFGLNLKDLKKMRDSKQRAAKRPRPKKIRDKFGLDFNVEVEIIEPGGEVKLRKKSEEHPVDKVTGILNSPLDTDKFLDEIRGK